MKPSASETIPALLFWGAFLGFGPFLMWFTDFEPLFRGAVFGSAGLLALWFLPPTGGIPRHPTFKSVRAAVILLAILSLCGTLFSNAHFLPLLLAFFIFTVLALWWIMRPEPEEPGPQRFLFLTVRMLAVLGVGGVGALSLALLPLGQGHMIFHRAKYEAIVAEVRRTLSTGTTQTTELTVHGRRVWAGYSEAGKLRVVILTNPRGHAGSYGYAYAEDALEPKPRGGEGGWGKFPTESPLDQIPGDGRIDEHWWRVEDHLD